MVVKTDRCSFSEQKIYPGHGLIFIRKDARKFRFLSSKQHCLFKNSKKPLKLRWTKAWRRAHKKEQIIRQVKKEKKKSYKRQRGIEGLSLSALLEKKLETSEQRQKNRQDKIKMLKQQNKGRINRKLELKKKLKQLQAEKEGKKDKKEENKNKQKKGNKQKQQNKNKGQNKQQNKNKNKKNKNKKKNKN